MAYATVDELKDQIGKTGTDEDTVLEAILDAASVAIDNFCQRPDGFEADAAASVRTYSGDGGPILDIDEYVEVTLVEVKDSPTDDDYTAWEDEDWIPFSGDARRPNLNPIVQGRPYTAIMVSAVGSESIFTDGRTSRRGVPTVRVTARWGYAATVPAVVRQAAITQATRWWKRGGSAWADSVGSPTVGQLFYRRDLDPDLKMMLVNGALVRMVV